MKLLVRKLWYPHSIDDPLTTFLSIPQAREKFDEGYVYDGEMRPRGIKLSAGYWPADPILGRLPNSDRDVYLVLTSMDLKGDFGRVHGKGLPRKAIASNHSFIDVYGVFRPDDIRFASLIFGEIGHAIRLEHHEFNSLNPCEMAHGSIPGPHWTSLDEIRFCDDCYQKIK